jgi:3-methyladenine DNA glycosylase AlkD
MKAQSRSSSIQKKRSEPIGPRAHKQPWTKAAVLRELKSRAEACRRAKMAYFGINVSTAHGISAPELHRLAKQIGKDHPLARELWLAGVHEARIIATLIGEPDKLNATEMDRWARDFNSWDIVDSACHFYAYSRLAWKMAAAWSHRREEFVKRAGFSLMAYLSYKDKTASDERFVRFLPLIEREAYDERNFVRKAVNWALRNIGKRNLRLNREAIRAAERIRRQGSRAARWVAADALRELKSPAVQARLRRKTS